MNHRRPWEYLQSLCTRSFPFCSIHHVQLLDSPSRAPLADLQPPRRSTPDQTSRPSLHHAVKPKQRNTSRKSHTKPKEVFYLSE